jgi:short-subunit dehydrogenase
MQICRRNQDSQRMNSLSPGDDTHVVVITGGSSGIGRCTAELFARRGWRVGLIARGAEGLGASRRELELLGARVACAQADVTNSGELHAATHALIAALGPIDLWINCAGVGVFGRFDDVPEADFRRVTDVTYMGAVNGTREALRHMRSRNRGTILNVCSSVAFHGLPLMSSYSGAKAALCAFSEALQGELRLQRSSIRVVTVFPPAVNTPFFDHSISHDRTAARPAWPVYQPEVVAQGIWQAFIGGRSRVSISGTAVAFRIASRIAPALIAWCMTKIDFERRPTNEEIAKQFPEPTLHEPSRRFAGTHGAFDRGARNNSVQLWLQDLFTKPARWLVRARRGLAAPPVVPLPPIPVPGEQD